MNQFQLIGNNIANPEAHGDLWLISGRIPGDDDDTAYVVIADSDEMAIAAFTSQIARIRNISESDWIEIEQNWDARIFFSQIFKFANMVRP